MRVFAIIALGFGIVLGPGIALAAQTTEPAPADSSANPLGQTTEATPTPTPSPANEEIRPVCQDADDAFASHFDLWLIGVAAICTLILPLLLPFLGVRRWWWLTYPYKRWAYITLTGLLFFAVILYGAAFAVTMGWISPRYALLLLGVDRLYPSGCINAHISVSTAGFLWGIIGAGREFSILAIPKMAMAGGISFAVTSALYWAIFFIWRRLAPLQPQR